MDGDINKYLQISTTLATFLVIGVGLILSEGTIKQKISHSKHVAFCWFIYSILDYGLMLLSIALVAIARSLEITFGTTTLAMFIFDIITAWFLLQICLRTNTDLTLGKEYRKSTALIYQRSKFAGMSAFTILLLKSAVWDGPERMIEFFHYELYGRKILTIFSLATLSIIQALFWTSIYWLGFNLFQ